MIDCEYLSTRNYSYFFDEDFLSFFVECFRFFHHHDLTGFSQRDLNTRRPMSR